MRVLVLIMLLLCCAGTAEAACGTAAGGQQAYDGAGQACAALLPSPLRGQGNSIIPASTSTAVNASLSLAANAGTFPTGVMGGRLTIKNSAASTSILYVCWQGGTCSVTVGEPLAVGESATESLPNQNMTSAPPTVFSVSSTITLKW